MKDAAGIRMPGRNFDPLNLVESNAIWLDIVTFARGNLEAQMCFVTDSHPEQELAYLRSRVVSLEVIVCELLAKNERLRMALQPLRLSAQVESRRGGNNTVRLAEPAHLQL